MYEVNTGFDSNAATCKGAAMRKFKFRLSGILFGNDEIERDYVRFELSTMIGRYSTGPPSSSPAVSPYLARCMQFVMSSCGLDDVTKFGILNCLSYLLQYLC